MQHACAQSSHEPGGGRPVPILGAWTLVHGGLVVRVCLLGSCSVPGSEAAGKRPGGGALSGSAEAAGAGWPLDAMKRVTLGTLG